MTSKELLTATNCDEAGSLTIFRVPLPRTWPNLEFHRPQRHRTSSDAKLHFFYLTANETVNGE
jgi:hypothetical protein